MFLRPRRDQAAHLGPRVKTAWHGPPHLTTTRAANGELISGLNHTAFDLATTLRSGGQPPPRKTRFPGAGPALPDGIGYPQGFIKGFTFLR